MKISKKLIESTNKVITEASVYKEKNEPEIVHGFEINNEIDYGFEAYKALKKLNECLKAYDLECGSQINEAYVKHKELISEFKSHTKEINDLIILIKDNIVAWAKSCPDEVRESAKFLKETYNFSIIDQDLVPREFLVPDEKKIKAYVSALKEAAAIPGVAIEPGLSVVMTAK